MAEMEKRPWRFTIEFDDEKAKKNGYNVDDLYDCVGKYAEQMGNVRIGLGTWQAKNRKVQFGAQCPVCATLSKQPWVMPIDKAMAVMEKLQQRYPWFKDSLLAASVTEVGERHDALSYIKGSHGIIVPVPTHSLGLEELDFFGSEIGDMKSATAELSKRNGLEPPKDLNNEH